MTSGPGFARAGFTRWTSAPVRVRPAPGGCSSGPVPFAGPATFMTADNPHRKVASDDENLAAGRG